MSQENVEIVRRFLEGAQETPDAVWDIFDEEVEWDTGMRLVRLHADLTILAKLSCALARARAAPLAT